MTQSINLVVPLFFANIVPDNTYPFMKHILLTLLTFFSLSAYGTDIIAFKHLGIKEGLSDSQINFITQDSQGFMWFSTSYGLNRYDGYSMKIFTRDSKSNYSLPDNYVEDIHEDANGMLWIHVGREKYVCYNPRQERFQPAMPILKNKYGINSEPSLLYIDKQKDLWAYTNDGVFHYCHNKQNTYFFPLDPVRKTKDIALTGISEDQLGILLIYSDGSFERIDPTTNKITYQNNDLSHLTGSQLGKHTLFVDTENDYWIYCSNGIWVYYTQENRWEHLTTDKTSPYILSGKHVYDIKQDKKGQLWIAIDHGGINIINKKQHTITFVTNDPSDERSLIQNSNYCLYNDENGGMWVGSSKKGVSFYHESAFKFRTEHFYEFSDIKNFTADVNAIVEDASSNLWIGTSNGLIFKNQQRKETQLYRHIPGKNSLPGDVVVCLLNSNNDGKIWIGVYQKGLCSFDGQKFTYYQHNPKDSTSLANNNVWALAEDEKGYIWIGTLGDGLFGLNPRTGKITRYAPKNGNFKHEYISSICIGHDNNLYIGTSRGIVCYSPSNNSFERWTGNKQGTQAFSHLTINDIYEDSRGLLWIATAEGLNIYDRRTDEIIMPVSYNDMKNEIVQAIIEDSNKNMWITTTRSMFNIIVHVDPATNTYNYTYRKYNEQDELRNQQFNARAISRTSQGEIMAGGVQGLSLFEPENIKYNNYTPQVKFTELQIFNQNIPIKDSKSKDCILSEALPYTSEIKLDYSQNVFSVYFSAMNYVQPEKTKYLYMLEGFNTEWLNTQSHQLTYTNLTPGTYTLKVKSINSDGFCSKETAELKIIIAPPIWKSPAAYVFYCILCAGLLFLARKYMLYNERQKYKLIQIEQEARQKHEIDDMKLKFFTNISHELRTPLTLILSPLEYVIQHTDDKETKGRLEIAHRNAVRLLNMVNQLLDFRKSDIKGHQLNLTQGDIIEFIHNVSNNFSEYSERKNINLIFFSAVKELWMAFDEDKISKIIMNLLSNAFKFTPEGGRVDVSLDIIPASGSSPEMLEIKVADNGIGISDDKKTLIFERFYQIPQKNRPETSGSGIGLHLVKEFVTLHKGNITVQDNIGKGSVFIITLPIQHVSSSIQKNKELKHTDEKVPSIISTTEEPEQVEKNIHNKRPVILIVDDNDDFRLFMKDCLAAEYIIHEATNGAQAWKIIPELQPDIVISDVMMPEIDGNELCRLVKNDLRTSHILFILLTARSAQEHELKGLENGADDYITKPFNLDILTLRIKSLLQKRRENYNQHMEVSPSPIAITSLDEKLIKKAIKYVEDNIERSELSVEELSHELGMSRVHLYKKLLSITGKTPIEFIRIIRLKRAAQFLRESQLSISEIAYQTGFNNIKFFRKYFKETFGVLPSEYQEKNVKHNKHDMA